MKFCVAAFSDVSYNLTIREPQTLDSQTSQQRSITIPLLYAVTAVKGVLL